MFENLRGHARTGSDFGCAEHVEVYKIGEQVDCDDRACSQDQRPRQSLFGPFDFRAQHTGVVPTVVGPQRGHQSRKEAGDSSGVGRDCRAEMRGRSMAHR